MASCASTGSVAADTALQVYLLGTLDFEAALRFQRRLQYDVSGDRSQAVLMVCEHPSLITVGRHGSHAHILCSPAEMRARQWSIRWVNRAGGCLLHVPGQLAVYPIFALDRLGLTVPEYLDRLHDVVRTLLADFNVESQTRATRPGVWAGTRPLAAVGVSVRDWVSYFGAWINVNPDLEPFRWLRWGGTADEPMTSLVRERRGPVHMSLVRERLIDHVRDGFGFGRLALFSDHPALRGSTARCQETARNSH